MRTEQFDGTLERTVVGALVMQRQALTRIAQFWRKPDPGKVGPLPSRWASLVGQWCVDYLAENKDAPGRMINAIFGRWAARREAQGDPATVKLVESFLANLVDERALYGDEGIEYVVGVAAALMQRAALRSLIESLQEEVDAEQLDAAVKRVEGFRKIDTGGQDYTVLRDRPALEASLSETEARVLIRFPGDLGRFYGDSLARSCFVSFVGPEKRGKTFHALDMAVTALQQRRRVAFFEVGDMTRNQVLRRLAVRLAQRPLNACTLRYPAALQWENSDNDAGAEVVWEERVFDEPLTVEEVWDSIEEFHEYYVRHDDDFLRLVCRPAQTVSVPAIKAQLEAWDNEGWEADVVIIDYADLLVGHGHDTRERTNDVWTRLSALRQERDCLVVTATQASAKAYTMQLLRMDAFSEDKRKNAHVTGMVGLNRTERERARGVMRLNWATDVRDEESGHKIVWTAPCFATCSTAVRSLMR